MSRILEKLADQHEERMINVLYKLEEDVVKEVTRATKGQLVSQRLAIQLRPKIKELVENNFLNEADLIINEEYNKIAKEVLDTFGEMPIPAPEVIASSVIAAGTASVVSVAGGIAMQAVVTQIKKIFKKIFTKVLKKEVANVKEKLDNKKGN